MTAADFLPPPGQRTLPIMAAAAEACQGCELFRDATHAVFGEGPANARLMLIGEAPGGQEDKTGRPFIGPAGNILNEALALAGIDRAQTYVTSAIKHFPHEVNNGRKKVIPPKKSHIVACRPWLEAQVEAIQPKVMLCLGRVGAIGVAGRDVAVTKERGQPIATSWPAQVLVTFHPAGILRTPNAEIREARMSALVADLILAWQLAQ